VGSPKGVGDRIRPAMSVAELETAICEILAVPEAERSRRHRGDRRTEIGYRAAWARTLLRKEGAIERTGFGKWRLVQPDVQNRPSTSDVKSRA
jgi:hypothetical protein